jgi:hypothetical protein
MLFYAVELKSDIIVTVEAQVQPAVQILAKLIDV